MNDAPLRGLRLLITRPEGRAGDICRRLESLGATVIQEALTRTAPLDDEAYAPLDAALNEIGSFDWIVFTSAEGVRFFSERAAHRKPGVHTLADFLAEDTRLAAVGPGTANAVAAHGGRVDVVPDKNFRAEGLVTAIKAAGTRLSGARILFARAETGRNVIPEALTAAGADVVLAPAYRTVGLPEAAGRVAARLDRDEIDLVVAASGLPLDELASALSCKPETLGRIKVAALGPVTAEHARELGFTVEIVPPEATMDSLVDALVAGQEAVE